MSHSGIHGDNDEFMNELQGMKDLCLFEKMNRAVLSTVGNDSLKDKVTTVTQEKINEEFKLEL